MPTIYNKKIDKNIPKEAVYCGRPTDYGNPFSHMPGSTLAKYKVATRDEACDAYEKWIFEPEQAHILIKIKKNLKGKDLICWCVPHRCHCSTIMRIANE